MTSLALSSEGFCVAAKLGIQGKWFRVSGHMIWLRSIIIFLAARLDLTAVECKEAAGVEELRALIVCSHGQGHRVDSLEPVTTPYLQSLRVWHPSQSATHTAVVWGAKQAFGGMLDSISNLLMKTGETHRGSVGVWGELCHCLGCWFSAVQKGSWLRPSGPLHFQGALSGVYTTMAATGSTTSGMPIG